MVLQVLLEFFTRIGESIVVAHVTFFACAGAGSPPVRSIMLQNGLLVGAVVAIGTGAGRGHRHSIDIATAFLVTMAMSYLFEVATAVNVLIIWDDASTNANTVSLKNALAAAGHTVTLSSVSETAWDGTNPSLAGFKVVIHLDGTTYSTNMPTAGQTALLSFVQNGGGYIGSEWLACENARGTGHACALCLND